MTTTDNNTPEKNTTPPSIETRAIDSKSAEAGVVLTLNKAGDTYILPIDKPSDLPVGLILRCLADKDFATGDKAKFQNKGKQYDLWGDSFVVGEYIDLKYNGVGFDVFNYISHKDRTDNPHQISKAQIGLDNLPNAISDATDLDDSNTLATSKAVYDLQISFKGVIAMWSGQICDIPTGWALCDGNNNTPDLSGRFIVGYDKDDNDYSSIGKTAGAKSVALTTSQMPRHNHSISDPGHNHNDGSYNRLLRVTGTSTSRNVDSTSGEPDLINSGTIKHRTTGISIRDTGSGYSHENRPPYYVLAYIMKL